MREPSRSFSGGGIKYEKALRQHQKLRGIYRRHGYRVELLPKTFKYVAGTFTQDTAFVAGDQALLTNLMSSWRTKEPRHLNQLRRFLERHVEVVGQMGLPAMLDVGEVVKTDTEYMVGIATKAARVGVKQIRERLDLDLPIRTIKRLQDGMPHLGSGLSYLGDGWLLASEWLEDYHRRFEKYKVIWVSGNEENGANAVRLADGCLVVSEDAVGTIKLLRGMGWEVETINLSEYNKAWGHISCLSINIEL